MVSVLSEQRKNDFQGVTPSTNFPNAPSAFVESLEEPDEGVDEGDPQQNFDPDIGNEHREGICRSDDDKIAR